MGQTNNVFERRIHVPLQFKGPFQPFLFGVLRLCVALCDSQHTTQHPHNTQHTQHNVVCCVCGGVCVGCVLGCVECVLCVCCVLCLLLSVYCVCCVCSVCGVCCVCCASSCRDGLWLPKPTLPLTHCGCCRTCVQLAVAAPNAGCTTEPAVAVDTLVRLCDGLLSSQRIAYTLVPYSGSTRLVPNRWYVHLNHCLVRGASGVVMAGHDTEGNAPVAIKWSLCAQDLPPPADVVM